MGRGFWMGRRLEVGSYLGLLKIQVNYGLSCGHFVCVT